MNKAKGITFRRKVKNFGDSHYLLLSKDIMEYLKLKVNDAVIIAPENGKHGKFISAWKEVKDDT